MAFVSKRKHLSLICSVIRTFDMLVSERKLFFYTSILLSLILISEGRSTCTVNGVLYICNNIANKSEFPLELPKNVRKVMLIGTNELKSFPDAMFNHQTWANVSELSILEFTNVKHIERGFLNGLDELKFLSISSCTELDSFDQDIFHSTPNIEALHFDGNTELQLSIVEAALIDKLSNLKYLSLIEIQAYKHHVVLGDNFSKALHRKNLTYLDISRVNVIYVENVIVQDWFTSLIYLNLSYSKLVLTWGKSDQSISLIQNLELLDLTGVGYIVDDDTIEGKTLLKDAGFPTAKYLFFQGIVNPASQIRLVGLYSFENCDIKFPKMLDLSKNRITLLNITFLGDCRPHALETLNLASNNMKYISPNFLSMFPSLKILDLSNNLLMKMQDKDEFNSMFSQNKDLEVVYLRNNHLTFVSSNAFISNSKLRIIDFSENELSYFNIDLRNAADIKVINLRKNRLKSLPGTFLEHINELFRKQDIAKSNIINPMTNDLLKQFLDRTHIGKRYRYGYNERENEQFEESQSVIPQYVMINAMENPLVCDCDTLVFFKWILFTDIDIVHRTAMTCKYGNNEKLLNNELFEMVKENCRLGSTIGIAIASSATIIISICTIAIMIHLRLKSARINHVFKNLKNEILRENAKFKFLVFLSYCSEDSHVVEETILPSLNRYINVAFNTEKNLVCTGADSFVPGMRIIEEIHRCINESLVLVPVITPAFLQSQWSQEECVAAVDRHRHVVILMKQHTDTSGALATIQHLIGQYTRGTWSDNEGNFVIQPSWNTICEGIIRGASESFRHYMRQNVITPSEEISLVEETV